MIDVRAVRAGDAAQLRALRLRAMADAPDAFAMPEEEEARRPDAEWARLARDSERAEEVVVYAAIAGERWMGMAAGRWHDRDRGVAHLWGMWVDPELRRRRVGERLVDAVGRWAAGRGGRLLRLGVIAAEGDATPFYESLGFIRTGEVVPLRRDPARFAHYLIRPVGSAPGAGSSLAGRLGEGADDPGGKEDDDDDRHHVQAADPLVVDDVQRGHDADEGDEDHDHDQQQGPHR